MTQPQGTIDFFISYRGAQAAWARWVNWVARTAGFSTVLMDEFMVGTRQRPRNDRQEKHEG